MEVKPKQPTRPFQDETDSDLLTIISWNEEDPANSRLAFKEFVFRFNPYIWKILNAVVNLSREDREDIHQNILVVIFQKAGTFDSSKAKKPEEVPKMLKSWIGTITKNEFRKYFRAFGNQSDFISLEDMQIDRVNDTYFSGLSPIQKQAFEDAFNSLEKMEQEIIQVSFLFFRNSKQVDKQERDAIEKKYGITFATFRKRKERAIKKMKHYVETKLGGK